MDRAKRHEEAQEMKRVKRGIKRSEREARRVARRQPEEIDAEVPEHPSSPPGEAKQSSWMGLFSRLRSTSRPGAAAASSDASAIASNVTSTESAVQSSPAQPAAQTPAAKTSRTDNQLTYLKVMRDMTPMPFATKDVFEEVLESGLPYVASSHMISARFSGIMLTETCMLGMRVSPESVRRIASRYTCSYMYACDGRFHRLTRWIKWRRWTFSILVAGNVNPHKLLVNRSKKIEERKRRERGEKNRKREK